MANSYKEEIVKEPYYTEIPEKYWELSANVHDLKYIKKIYKLDNLTIQKLFEICSENPNIAAYYMFGFTLRPHQMMSMDYMIKYNRIAECWSRRMGKTFKNQIFSLWSTVFDKFPSISTGTTWNILLQDVDTAKDLYIQPMYEKLENADKIVAKNFKGMYGQNFFTSRLLTRKDKSGKVTSNQISFRSTTGKICRIFALPTTKKAIGREGNIIGDEVSKWKYNNALSDDVQFYQQLKPILIDNPNFKGIFTSTPEGPDDVFAYIFNPEDNPVKEQEFKKIWLPYTARREQHWLDSIEAERQKHIQAGTIATFQQEFEAKFVQTDNMFFTQQQISQIINTKLKTQYSELVEACYVGVDWGGSTKSQTAIAVVKYKPNENMRTLIYYKAYPVNQDQSAVQDIIEICRKYNIKILTVDNKGGRFAIPQLEKAVGKHRIKEFNFSTEKLTGYNLLKECMIEKSIEIPYTHEIITQFRTLNNKLKPQSTKDKDDIIDSIMLAIQPTIQYEQRKVKVITY